MMYLSRLTLRRDPSVRALGLLLNPKDEGPRLDAHHRLIWSAFAGDPQATRDFLWRDEGRGQFLVLSPRPPGESPLFEAPRVKDYTPDLAAGDRLAFVLRANATRARRGAGRVDVVMDALHDLPKDQRAEKRMEIAQSAGRDWLAGQGARAGFRLLSSRAAGYRVVQPPGRGARRPRFGVLDLEGVLEVTDPAAFLVAQARGFGRAKAFGCGLMLVRRA